MNRLLQLCLLIVSVAILSVGCRQECKDKRESQQLACEDFIALPTLENEALMIAQNKDAFDSECAPSGCDACEGYTKRVYQACQALRNLPGDSTATRYYNEVKRYKEAGCQMSLLLDCN